jgi:small subunit ribosomal protein S9
MKLTKNYTSYGTGRRKSAVARVWLKNGEGKISINGRDYDDYLRRPVLSILVRAPLEELELTDKFDVVAQVKGGGTTGQAGAVQLGIARSLVELDENLRKSLRAGGFLTRDPRVKERKKYGRKKARRGFQFVKR